MKYQLVDLHVESRPIERGEALSLIIDCGSISPQQAENLLDALPCGFRIGLPGVYGWGPLIERRG